MPIICAPRFGVGELVPNVGDSTVRVGNKNAPSGGGRLIVAEFPGFGAGPGVPLIVSGAIGGATDKDKTSGEGQVNGVELPSFVRCLSRSADH